MQRTIVATVAAVATWIGIAMLARLLVPVPAGAFAFLAVTIAAMFTFGQFLPLSGFGTGSFVLLLSFALASLVALWWMDTPLLTLVVGVLVLFFAATPALFVFTVVRGDSAGSPTSGLPP